MCWQYRNCWSALSNARASCQKVKSKRRALEAKRWGYANRKAQGIRPLLSWKKDINAEIESCHSNWPLSRCFKIHQLASTNAKRYEKDHKSPLAGWRLSISCEGPAILLLSKGDLVFSRSSERRSGAATRNLVICLRPLVMSISTMMFILSIAGWNIKWLCLFLFVSIVSIIVLQKSKAFGSGLRAIGLESGAKRS